MKRLLTIVLLLGISICGTCLAQDSRLNDKRYLVGYWPLNSHALDESGHGNHGTWSGTEAYATGRDGHTVGSFNGSSYVSIGDKELVTTTVSFGGWVYLNDTSTLGVVIGKNGGQDGIGGYTLQVNVPAAGQIVYDVKDTTMSGNIYNAGLVANNWCHLFVTYDGANIVLYVDGKAVDSTARTGSIGISSRELQIGGQDNTTAPRKINGKLTEQRIYNVALTGDEVWELFTASRPELSIATQPIPQIPDVSDSTLAGAWFNKLTDTTDLSSNNKNATVTNCVLGGGEAIFSNGNFVIASTTFQTQSYWALEADGWNHYVSNGTTVWKNTVSGASLPVTVGATGFTGQTITISDLRLYTDVKSAAWIANEYARCVPDDRLNYVSGNGFDDYSKHRRAITRNGSVTTLSNGATFDGATGYVEYTTPYPLALTDNATISFWINPAVITSGTVYSLFGGDWDTSSYTFRITTGGKLLWSYKQSTSQTTTNQVFYANMWQKIDIVLDASTNSIDIYRNGSFLETDTSTGDTGLINRREVWGTLPRATPLDYFSGKLALVRQLFGTKLSADEIGITYEQERQYF